MSTDFVSVNVDKFICEAYHAEWELTNLLSYKGKKLISPPFCPLLSNLDIKFCFEVWLVEFKDSNFNAYAIFKFVLVKLDESTVPASLKLEIELKVKHSNGKLIKEYHGLPIITVEEMGNYYFEEIRKSLRNCRNQYSDFGNALKSNEPFVVNCRMKFLSHLEDSSGRQLPSPGLCSLGTLKTSSDHAKSFKRCDEFSDIVVRVGCKLFFAHKSVLSHHSSVLKQMVDQKPDNESILVLDDEECDAFDSFLDYLYAGKFEGSSWPMVREVYILSAKYEVDALKKKCAAAILSHLSVDKVCDILKIAYDYDGDLKKPATLFAVEHIREIILSQEWKEFIATHPIIGCEVTTCALKI